MFIDDEIGKLNQYIKQMSRVVQENIRMAFDLYLSKDTEIFIDDDIVNQFERKINELCVDILTKERPYSKDLRDLTAVLKLVSDLERIGDHAEDIKEFSLKLKNTNQVRLPKMVGLLDKSLKMVDDAILSFVTMDKELALKTIKADDEIDALYAEMIQELTNYEVSDKASLAFVIYTTLLAKYFERIADHATNIGEWVVFILTGKYKEEIENV